MADKRNDPKKRQTRRSITHTKAIDIARTAASEHALFSRDVVGEVEESDTELVVTFPTRHPVGVRGADYHARVVLDKFSGDVKQILGGS